MMRLLSLVLFSFIHIAASAQPGNEWINVSAPYYKIPVGKNGIFRLNRAQLVSAGVPSFIDPKTIKLYHRGVEQSIYVEGENDGQLNTNDFVEFYGRQNDGTLDQKLFASPSAQPHLLYNIFSDTTAYFLTYGGGTGKRATTNSSVSTLSPETFHWDERLLILHNEYSGGVDYGDIQLSGFETGEGWTGSQIFQNQTVDYLISGINNSVPAAGLPKVEILVTGRGPLSHSIEISAGSRLLATISLNGYESQKFEADLAWADISPAGEINFRIYVTGSNNTPARASVGYIKVSYPQAPTFGGTTEKHFHLAENALGVSNVQLQSPPAGAVVYDVTDPDNVLRLPVSQAATLDFVVPNTTSKRKIYAASVFTVPGIKRIRFRDINPSAQDYVIITHSSLRKPVSGYTDPVKALAEYRSQPAGGSYDTLIVNIEQLYNQFSYGETTPLAIYNFLRYLKTGKLPSYLFLIGKGLNINYGYNRNISAFPQFKDLVPTAGYPASDMRFSAGLSGLPNVPAIATGRLSAMGPADVAAYFNKVKEFEAAPFDNLQRKNILHLSGGLYNNEPQLFRSYLETFAATAESVHLGGEVKAIAKRSTDIEVINVADEVNNGLNLVTLFGHSSPASADFDIGLVTDPLMGYNNKGKYPALLLNGCLAGSYFLNGSILGENWTNAPDRGAISVIAHSSFGFSAYLKIYSEYFYHVAYGDSVFINKGLGDVQKEIAKRFLSDYGNTPVPESQVQQMVLLGDPALSLFRAPKPDYAIVPNSISIASKDGSRLSALSDSLVVTFTVNNYGKAKAKKIHVSLERTLNDNSVIVYDTIVNATLYSDTLSFLLPGRIDEGFGNNTFSIAVDSENDIDELNEDNNTFASVFFIPLSGTKNLYPDEYAIVRSLTPIISFQHTDHLSEKRQFILQIDTTKTFSSPFLKEYQIEAQVLASKAVQLTTKDSLVYYWRTKLAQPEANENVNWETSSFTYINNGPTGWAQSTFGQFEENFIDGLEANAQARKIEFEQTVTQVDVQAFGAARSEVASVKINGAEYNLYNEENNFQCRQNTINLIAFNKTTTQPYAGVYFNWLELRDMFGGAALLCGREPYVINSFRANEVAMGNSGDLLQYIDNVAAGDSVVLFTIGDPGIATWPAAAKEKLELLGISSGQLTMLAAGEPIVIMARKGATPGDAKIYQSQSLPASNSSLSVNATITGRASQGQLATALIGPARQWHDFLVKYKTDSDSDIVAFRIDGVDLSGKSTLLYDDVSTSRALISVDAASYPYLKITFKTQDDTFVTAAELKRWMVTYEPVAEGLLLYHGPGIQQVLSEGEKWSAGYSFINISEKSFLDSLTVFSEVTKSGTGSATVTTSRIDAPDPGDTTKFTVELPTVNQAGINDIFVNVNPRIEAENDYDNNFITLPEQLKVLPDTLAPLLEVTFDGRFIANEEYVSPTPDIIIKLIDNNPFRLITDTIQTKLFIKGPCEGDECAFQPLYFSDPNLSWTPETNDAEFQVRFTREFEVDGLYTFKVDAADAAGNKSGEKPFEISFNVAHENTVVIAAPYPNPFAYKTNFQIDVIGDMAPDNIVLTIVNTRGALIQRFTNADFGSLHIGTNSFSWTGLDQSGVPVPNGVYIFKLEVDGPAGHAMKTGKLVVVR